MAMYKVQKRNGAIVTFEKSKIENAITKAIESVHGADFSEVAGLADLVIQHLTAKYGNAVHPVERIQDVVEEVLIKAGHDQVAKSYILYRQKKAELRQDKSVVVEVEKSMDEYLDRSDWRVNANANQGYSLGGLILNVSGKVTANYWLSKIYPGAIGSAHRNGDIHIHDLDMFCGYCAGWSLRQLLEEGFNGVPNKIESTPPKNLQSAVNQMINFLGTLQNERAGAQAFSSFDTYLAPFVHKYMVECEQELGAVRAQFETPQAKQDYIQTKTYKYIVQQLQNFIFGMNTPSRWGTQTPFSNITLDRVCPEDLKDKALYLGGMGNGPYVKKFGELEQEMRLINRALIQVYTQGDAKGRVFTFPIPTYNITEDFPRDDPDIDGIFEMTAKYGIPYFQNFVGSQWKRVQDEHGNWIKVKNPDAYTPGAVRSMCCRLQLDLTQLTKRGNGLFGSAEMTGSIGVVTINLARIGYNYKDNVQGFKDQVLHLMSLAKTSLEIKRQVLTNWMEQGLYPYSYRYLRSFRNHFSTIGINGMNEAILNFTQGEHDMTTQWGRDFACDVLDMMRDKLKEYQEQTGNLYNLEATPAEGTTYRFAKEDKRQHPDIIQSGTPEAPYYTNSTQIPVAYTDDAFEALELQNDLQCKYTGGTVLHLYMGERISDAKACKTLVKKVLSEYQLPYITITPTFSICPKHGYLAGEHDFCPRCDEEIGYTGLQFDVDLRSRYTADAQKMQEFEHKMIGAQ